MLSERDDIIVIADEAHRTQYDTLALNLRNALPNAAFLAFTGTPLIAGEERTQGGVRRLRLDLQLPPVDRGSGDGAALLREPVTGDADPRHRGVRPAHAARSSKRPNSTRTRSSGSLGSSAVSTTSSPTTTGSTPSPRTWSSTSSPAAIRARRWSSPSTRRPPSRCTTVSRSCGTTDRRTTSGRSRPPTS